MKRFFLVILGSTFVSIMSAFIVQALLTERVDVVGSWFGLQYSLNPGIAFGIRLPPIVQEITIIAALIAVLMYAYRTAKTDVSQWGFGMILGGGLANILDRLHDGYVTDMIQVGSFPIFNIADSFITIGVGVLLLEMLCSSKG